MRRSLHEVILRVRLPRELDSFKARSLTSVPARRKGRWIVKAVRVIVWEFREHDTEFIPLCGSYAYCPRNSTGYFHAWRTWVTMGSVTMGSGRDQGSAVQHQVMLIPDPGMTQRHDPTTQPVQLLNVDLSTVTTSQSLTPVRARLPVHEAEVVPSCRSVPRHRRRLPTFVGQRLRFGNRQGHIGDFE